MAEPLLTRVPKALLAAGILAVITAGLAVLAAIAGSVLPTRTGPPVERLVVERTLLTPPSTIELVVRNSGPDPVTVAQASVNDSFVALTGGDEPIGRLGTATLRLDYPWQDGMPYTVSLLTSTGAVIDQEIPVAVTTPQTTPTSIARMAALGAMIGVAPVLLGMCALPLLRRAGPTAGRALMGLTVGLLGFLAVDATLEGFELGAQAGAAFGGNLLFVLGAITAFLALAMTERVLPRGTAAPKLALLIAIGIGLHNLGEGLAVGSALAVGELALGMTLVVGFALHNTTEGIAVVAPLTTDPVGRLRLLVLGLVAGAPAVLGTVLGATLTTPPQATFLLGLGVGAIVQVVVLLAPRLRSSATGSVDGPVISGLAVGVLVMYATGLLVSA